MRFPSAKTCRMTRPLASVDNALKLLVMLQDGRPLRVTDAAIALGVSRPTAHRLLASLEFRHFVRQDPITRAYLVAGALVRNWLPPSEALVAAAKPEMRALARTLREATHLAVRSGTTITLIASAGSAQTRRDVPMIGTTLPAHFSSAGKALLAELPLEELRALYAAEDLRTTAWKRTKKLPESNATIWDELLAELKIVREQGYATNFRSRNRGVNAIACPIVMRNGRTPGALVVSAPSARTQRRAIVGYAEALRRAAARIAARLGSDAGTS